MPKKPDGFTKKYYPCRSMVNPMLLAHIKANRKQKYLTKLKKQAEQ